MWERRILKKIFLGKLTEVAWKKRTHGEIYEIYEDARMRDFGESRKLQWPGHLERKAIRIVLNS